MLASLADIKQPDPDEFEPRGLKGAIKHPDHVHYFFSKQQALAFANAPGFPPSSSAGQYTLLYLFKIYQAFYSDVIFYLDEEDLVPNAYSYHHSEKPFVIVSGGLIRKNSVSFEGLAFIIAHELAHLYGGEPLSEFGYSCEGQSDYAAIQLVMSQVWFGLHAAPLIKKAIEQIEGIFQFITDISPKAAQGNPGSKCMNISLECRLKAMKAGAETKPLPECAGGPPEPFLEVVGVTAVQDGSDTYVTVAFNVPVDPESAEAIGNYAFHPTSKVYSATVETSEPSQVKLKADLEVNTEYKLLVYDVVTKDKHQPLVFDKNRASFELKASDQ